MEAAAPLPTADKLRCNAPGDTHPPEEEGWLCFVQRKTQDGTIVQSVTDPDMRDEDPPEEEELCRDCSDRVVRARRALWAPVESHAEVKQPPELQIDGVLQVLDESKKKPKWVSRWVHATRTGLHCYDPDLAEPDDRPGRIAKRGKKSKPSTSRFFTHQTQF
eukprot:gene254-2919_t